VTDVGDNAARVAREAKARAEVARLVALAKLRKRMLRRWVQDGAFALKKGIGKSHQIVVPAEIVQRWTVSPGHEVTVLLLDLGWGMLVVPDFEAASFIADLGIKHSDLIRPDTAND
jgi:hypothetical protein